MPMSAATQRYTRRLLVLFILLAATVEKPDSGLLVAQSKESAKTSAGDAGQAGEQTKAKSPAEQAAATRLRFMTEACAKYQFSIIPNDAAETDLTADGKIVPIVLGADPLLRWSNPISSIKDGLLVVYTRQQRPVAFCQFQLHNPTFSVHEFTTVGETPLVMRRGARTIWTPDARWTKFQKLTDAPAAADKPALRQSQLKRLAREFSVVDDFGWTETTRYELRVMTQPVYRYQNVDDVLDGAVFVFAQGTNPEAVLVLECHRSSADTNNPEWRFAFCPATIYALEASRKGQTVWTKPRYQVFGSSNGPYHVGPYRPDPTDVSLKDAFPAAAKRESKQSK